MTMSSDKLATIRQPTVTVNFDVDESGRDRHISVELTNDELKHLTKAEKCVYIPWGEGGGYSLI